MIVQHVQSLKKYLRMAVKDKPTKDQERQARRDAKRNKKAEKEAKFLKGEYKMLYLIG